MGSGLLYFYRVQEKNITEDLTDAMHYWLHCQMYAGQRFFHQNAVIYANLLFLFTVKVCSIEINDFLNSDFWFSRAISDQLWKTTSDVKQK